MPRDAQDPKNKYRNGELINAVDIFRAGFKNPNPGPNGEASEKDQFLQDQANARKDALDEEERKRREAERPRGTMGG